MHSDTIAAISDALAKAQAAISNPTKNREVTVKSDKGSYKFKYATFDAILDAVRAPLTANGIWFIQCVDGGDMVTRLVHSSGEWLESKVPMAEVRGGPQQLGSALTYMKRYGLCAALGIAADEDDDGNAAEGNGVEFKSRNEKAPPQKNAATVAVPPQGWEAWAEGFINVVGSCDSDEAITRLQNSNKGELRALSTADPKLYAEIGSTIKARRAKLTEPQKEAA